MDAIKCSKFYLRYAFMTRIGLSKHAFAYRFQHGTRPKFPLQVSTTAAARVARFWKTMRAPATISSVETSHPAMLMLEALISLCSELQCIKYGDMVNYIYIMNGWRVLLWHGCRVIG